MNKEKIVRIAGKAIMIGAPILSFVAGFIDRKQTADKNAQDIRDSVHAEVERQLVKALLESTKET